jgi:RNA polymerase subunit RPABC4/transcription elongation factor Spt4
MKCVKCGAIIEKFEVFPESICVKCYAEKFKEEWASAIKVGRFK